MIDPMKTLAERLQWVVDQKLVASASAWCEAAGLTRTHVSTYLRRWKDGKSPDMGRDTLKSLADKANVRFAWLADGDGEPREGAQPRAVELTPRYQNIEAAIAYHPGRWSAATLSAGRGMARDGDEDRPPQEWEKILDRLEAAIGGKAKLGTEAGEDEAPPRARKRRG